MIGLLGTKIGMTQVFEENGTAVPVTVIKVDPLKVISLRDSEKHGYTGLEMAFGVKKPKNASKPIRERFSKLKMDVPKKIKEFRIDSVENIEIGSEIGLEILKEIEYVDVSGVTKGQGTQGVMKRHNFRGGPGGHGTKFRRLPGSIGQCSFPSKVFKGKKMAGQTGNEKKTLMNLKVHSIDFENNLLLVKGSVPGKNNSIVTIRPAVKKIHKTA